MSGAVFSWLCSEAGKALAFMIFAICKLGALAPEVKLAQRLKL
jgi:hypothetical protein